MRATIIAILGTAVATLVSAAVLPPISGGADLTARADSDEEYGCYCSKIFPGQLTLPLLNVTESCCHAGLSHVNSQLCMPVDSDHQSRFIDCCAGGDGVHGVHGFEGDCKAVKDIATDGNYPPYATEMSTSIQATPTYTAEPETTTQAAGDAKEWCMCYPEGSYTGECCKKVGGHIGDEGGLFDVCDLGSDKDIHDFDSCCKTADTSHISKDFSANCFPLRPSATSSASAASTPATDVVIVTVTVIETSIDAAPTQTVTATLVGPRQNDDDEKHYCWCNPANTAVTSQCCTEVDGLFYHNKLCVVPSRDKEIAFDLCCKDKDVGDHGTADYGACMDIDPDDHSSRPFTTTVTLDVKRGEVATTPRHNTRTTPYYITHHPVTL